MRRLPRRPRGLDAEASPTGEPVMSADPVRTDFGDGSAIIGPAGALAPSATAEQVAALAIEFDKFTCILFPALCVPPTRLAVTYTIVAADGTQYTIQRTTAGVADPRPSMRPPETNL